MDTGGGCMSTVTNRAWEVLQYTNHKTKISGYQDKGSPQMCNIVNAITKAKIQGMEESILLVMNYVTLVEDINKNESLCQPFNLMAHGIDVDMIPRSYGGKQGLTIEDTFIPFDFDGEKLYLSISKPTRDEIKSLECFELTSPVPSHLNVTRRKKQKGVVNDISITEWRKRLAMAPEDVVRKTFECTTRFYMTIPGQDRDDPRRHMQSRAPGLRLPRQNELVASDTFFPSKTSDRGNTCSQMFVGQNSDFWAVYPLKNESKNTEALQDYTRTHGCPNAIKTDCAQSELGVGWTQHCRNHCIEQKTTEPHHPWQNPSEKRIGNLNDMVRRCMRIFNVPIRKHDWVQKWCVDVHNVLASRYLNWRTPTEKKNGNTPDISMFRYHVWEPIWYFDPSLKIPQQQLQKGRWLGFARSAGDAFTYYVETERIETRERPSVLTRSVIKTRRKNVGTENEYIEENP